MESMYHNIYILYTLSYIGAYNINHNTWSYFKRPNRLPMVHFYCTYGAIELHHRCDGKCTIGAILRLQTVVYDTIEASLSNI